jgi:hypothetical protein
MKLKDHLARIQQKPRHQRERIAVIATAVAFLIILAIWLLTFSEMNKSTQPEVNSPAAEQLNDLKSSAGEGKKSIEEMWSQMPTQEDMINAEQQVAPLENNINSSEANQNIQGNGSGSESNTPNSETVPLDGNGNKDNNIPPLP